MITLNFLDTIEDEISLCLGFFDCVHKGHERIIQEGKSHGKVALFTFDTPLKEDGKGVYDLSERKIVLERLGVDYLIVARFEKIKDMSCGDFLKAITKSLNIKKVICGSDYFFGKNKEGSVQDLKEKFGAKLKIVDDVFFGMEKISTKFVKREILNGNVEKLSVMLTQPYFIVGKCEKGLQNGSKMGFPTANISPSPSKVLLKEGVYMGYVELDGKTHKAVMSVGSRPTFDSYEYKFEAHAQGVSEILYGKIIKMIFHEKIRDVKHFDSMDQLKERLKQDVLRLEKLN